MKKLINFCMLASVFVLVSFSPKTEKDAKNDWINMFNGKNLDGWIVKIHHHDVGDNYANTFKAVDGKIQVNYDGYTEFHNRYGHLFYKTPFSSYHLKFEYRFTDQWLIIHIVNGEKVLEYTKPQIGGGVANGFDPAIKTDKKPLTEGYIGLQAEGQGIEFKEIKIMKLD
ncbi:MAG: DUF1080 domain-containing protein [Draconibacterium sp.]|nr:DUF1080 domain-containing protein [Draconibacterium sp.]